MNRADYLQDAKEYAPNGAKCPAAKLTEKEVAYIKEKHLLKMRLVGRLNERYSAAGLVDRFNVHVRTIEKILNRETWIHVRSDL